MDKEEFFISLFKSKLIGDDGAIFENFIYSSDMFCENVHFKREWFTPYQIAKKATIVNISDVVAMNGKAKFALLNVQIPKDMDRDELKELAKGFQDGAKEFGFEIIGGDTVGGKELNITISLISESKKPLTRYGLIGGEFLAYTGELGGSLRDLNRLFRGEKIEKSSKFYEPTLRVEFISQVRDYIVAGMDISDGLFCDTNRLLKLNSVGLKLLKNISNEIGFSGEEYEMLIGFKREHKESILKIASLTSTPITIFGVVSKENSFRFECKSHHF
jgi:thiamine-monophosphate kinase